MVGFKYSFCALLLTVIAGVATAQNNTNSPYTRYGYGDMADQSFSNSKAMGGVAFGLRDGTQINPLNPASYTAVDSLTFLFDGGVTLQNVNMTDGKTKLNAKNSSFDYVAMQFRLRKGLAMSLGLLPYSYVGYNVSQSVEAKGNTPENTKTFAGEGGLNQLYAGLGYSPVKNFSVGVNLSYFWGEINRANSLYYPANSGSYSYSELTYVKVEDFKMDFGVQYTLPINKKSSLTLGAVYSPKNDLKNSGYVETTTSVVTKRDTVASYGTPNSYGVGAVYRYNNKWTIGLDYTLQQWGDVTYMNEANAFCDRHKISLGAEYLPSFTSRSYFSHVKYRVGGYYTTPYYKIDGERASKEFGLSAGVGLPVPRSRSVLSVSAQYVRVTGQGASMLDENIMRVSIGLTFNESWFRKWKVK